MHSFLSSVLRWHYLTIFLALRNAYRTPDRYNPSHQYDQTVYPVSLFKSQENDYLNKWLTRRSPYGYIHSGSWRMAPGRMLAKGPATARSCQTRGGNADAAGHGRNGLVRGAQLTEI